MKQFRWQLVILALVLLALAGALTSAAAVLLAFGPTAAGPAAGPVTLWQRIAQAPVGNGLALVTLLAMVLVLVMTGYRWHKSTSITVLAGWWTIPALALTGLGIMLYLTYLATVAEAAGCSPLYDCRIVHQSDYAYLLGIPISELGAAGYLAILLVWAASHFGSERLATLVPWALLALTTFGLGFAIYLTFLELFVIGVTCAWCLVSAVVMTILFWLSAETVHALRLTESQ